MSAPEFKREVFNIGAMHKDAQSDFKKLISATLAEPFSLGGKQCFFRPYEGFRHPMRQLYLVTETKSTKARPWESAHQYGLAIDFAVWVDQGDDKFTWNWDDKAPWGELKTLARRFFLDVPIEWDRGHVQHPLFDSFRAAIKRHKLEPMG